MSTVLIVDDLPAVHEMLEAVIGPAGFQVSFALSGEEAFQRYKEETFDIVIADISMKPMNGIQLLEKLKEYDPAVIVILMTGYASAETATAALKLGAFDYVTKPFKIDELIGSVKRASEASKAAQMGTAHGPGQPMPSLPSVKPIDVADALVGESKPIRAVSRQIQRLVDSPLPLLLMGEKGTGKRNVAQLIHKQGNFKEGPFDSRDCAEAETEELRRGLISRDGGPGPIMEKLEGGVLYLANIEMMDRALQDSLAEVMDASKGMLRIICGTTINLEEKIELGEFSEKLFYIIGTLPVMLPPLRERREDIEHLLKELLNNADNPWLKGKKFELSRESERLVHNYSWPGNVSEFNNVLIGALAKAKGRLIEADMLPSRLRSLDEWPCRDAYLLQQEKSYFFQLRKLTGNDSEAICQIAGIDVAEYNERLQMFKDADVPTINLTGGVWDTEKLIAARDAIAAAKEQPNADKVKAALEAIKEELDERQAQLDEMENMLNERANFIEESENTVFEKGMQLQEREVELDQMQEDIENRLAELENK